MSVDIGTNLHKYGYDTDGGTIFFSGLITEESANGFLRNLHLLNSHGTRGGLIHFSTSGGCVHSGLAMYDSIKHKPTNSDIVIIVNGTCLSMGAVVLQAAELRCMYKNAILMLHAGSSFIGEDSAENSERWLGEHKRVSKVADDILYKRIQEKRKIGRKRFEKMLQHDTIFTAKEALEWGLIDEII